MSQEHTTRAYLLSVNSVHRIRESLQIILDFAEQENNNVVINQVRRIMEEIAGQRMGTT